MQRMDHEICTANFLPSIKFLCHQIHCGPVIIRTFARTLELHKKVREEFTITEKAPTRPPGGFKNLITQYAKQTLTHGK